MKTLFTLLVLFVLALLVLGGSTVVSVFDVAPVTSRMGLSRFGSFSPATLMQDGEVHATPIASVDSRESSESMPQPCLFVEVKGPNSIRAITCAIPSTEGNY